jgi:Holliday junction resolvase-like predicted endonuclease
MVLEFLEGHLREVAVAAIFLVLGLWLYQRFARWRSRWRMARMRKTGREGEQRAERWLRSNGFRIETDQARRTCRVKINGEPATFEVRADFLVKNPRGELAVVEVKTGASADPRSSATRRQIFEYAAVYGVKDIYLFDGTQERLMHLEFLEGPGRSPAGLGGGGLRWLLVGALLGWVASWIV